MKKRIGYRRDFWLMIAIGSTLVILVILLGVSFFKAISDSETKSKREFLRRQTELAATEIEIDIDRFEITAKTLIDYLEDEDLDAEDFRGDFTKAARRVFNNYPSLIDTLWVDLQDSVVYLTRTERNDFIRNISQGAVPKKGDRDFIFTTKGADKGFELTFSLNPVKFAKDFVTHYYLNKGGSKLLMLGGKTQNLDPGQDSDMLVIDETSLEKIRYDVEIGVIGIYQIDWKKGANSGAGILVQYPFNLGDFYDDAALLFMVESDSILSGIYSTYLFLFSGFVFLLMGTVVFFTLSLQHNRESQKLLEESAEEISELFDQQNLLLKELRGFVYFHNFKGQITRVSDEVEVILGHPKSEFLEAFQKEDGHHDALNVKSLVKRALNQNKSSVDIEYDFIKPDGTKLRLRIFEKLVFDEQGRFNGGLGICTDITDQFLSKHELIESGKRLQNLIDNIPDVIFTFDNDGKVLDSHIKDQKFLQSIDRSLIGDSLFDLVPPKQREQTQFAFNLARKTEQIQTVDLKIEVAQESQYFEVRFFPLDSNRMMSVSKDITSQRIWEKGLVEAMNAADQASKAKSEFLANMSHEIRTPMNGLLGIIDLLDQTNLDAEQLQYLEIIKNSGNSLLSIIKDILDYSKIEAGKIEINSIVFSPAEELEKQVQIFYGLAQKKGVILTTVLEPATKELMEGDVEKINQVILNLVGNAVKFTPKGGTVVVKLEIENISGEIHYLRCSVKDSGIGIPKEVIPRLTDPFYQVESSSSRSYQGTGLGLAIAKKIVELMGGELNIASEPGVGSTFAFSVILKKAKFVAEYPSSEMPQRTNWNGMANEYPARILLAEDNELNLQLMTLMLGQLGYDFSVAKNGLEALDLVKSKDFDMILMDVQMPLLNGLEASKKIRELGDRGNVFIIGLSANVFDEDQKKATEAGMDDYLTKPIRLLKLAEKIKEYSLKRDLRNVK
ncbi:PAS domain-containing hybrid sensor histidine kinase/response regulator [Algoriphagus chordae]|uniref:Sensory/regulatory protein RpfC n=1 Tax=Algoriphagus chordae TaxID=237019 RepID=A0A2W7R2M9_9BACT|nr:PAS domain-containing hybrid sensor histidine kinase/response regulator [Algoriphagus chordae]PZX54794.1 PAS domain S-box-containing protein [Algoriphagus chordae]